MLYTVYYRDICSIVLKTELYTEAALLNALLWNCDRPIYANSNNGDVKISAKIHSKGTVLIL